MAYDQDLAHRIREQLGDETGVTEKAMFGGLAFLLGGNLAVGISNTGELMVRVGPDAADAALARPHTRVFDMTGRPMRGWILVEPEGIKTKRQLGSWVARGIEFARTLPPKGRADVSVDVLTQIDIALPRAEVATYASNPDNATDWYENIKSVVWRSPQPLAVGTKLEFVAQFLGRRLAYTYEVAELVPGERFVMRTAQGPFPMETTYTWEDASERATRMSLRNRGEPAGFAKLTAPMLAAAMRRANHKDLARLKAILERSAPN